MVVVNGLSRENFDRPLVIKVLLNQFSLFYELATLPFNYFIYS